VKSRDKSNSLGITWTKSRPTFGISVHAFDVCRARHVFLRVRWAYPLF